MKMILSNMANKWLLLIIVLFSNLCAFAQQGGEGAVAGTGKTQFSQEWFTAPWIWIFGAAVFIFLLSAILRDKNTRSDA